MASVVTINTAEVQKAFKEFRRLAERNQANVVKRVAFEARDAIRDNVKSTFRSTRGTDFLAKGVSVSTKPRELEATIFVKKASEKILAQHEEPLTITAKDGGRLAAEGKLAIPVSIKRSGRGKVPAAKRPSALLATGKAFISKSGKAIVLMKGPKRKPRFQIAFALAERARLTGKLDFLKTGIKAIEREFPRKVESEIKRLIEGKQNG